MDKDKGCRICGAKKYMGTVFCYEHYLENEKQWEYNNTCAMCSTKIRGVFTFCKACYLKLKNLDRLGLIKFNNHETDDCNCAKCIVCDSPIDNGERFCEECENRFCDKTILIEFVDCEKSRVIERNTDYVAKNSLTQAEIIFLKKLEQVIDTNKYKVETQKSLRQMVDKKMHNDVAYELNKDIDFVIVDRTNYSNVLLIEYNDSTHDRPERIKRDNMVKEICAVAKLNLIFIKRDDNMSVDYLRGKLEEYL